MGNRDIGLTLLTCFGQTKGVWEVKTIRVQAIFTPVLAFDLLARLLPLVEASITGQVQGRDMIIIAGLA